MHTCVVVSVPPLHLLAKHCSCALLRTHAHTNSHTLTAPPHTCSHFSLFALLFTVEVSALRALYTNWNNPILFKTWAQASDHCSWDYLTCEGGVVTSIHGPQNSVTQPSPIAIQLSQLTDLTSINLNQLGNLTGGIPKQLSVLTSLAFLDLGWNNIGGSIPRQLSALTALTQLELYRNLLTGGVPEQLSSLTRLTKLRLSINRLSGSLPPALSTMFNKCTIQYFLVNTNYALCGPEDDVNIAFPNIQPFQTGLETACNQSQGKPCTQTPGQSLWAHHNLFCTWHYKLKQRISLQEHRNKWRAEITQQLAIH